MKTGILRAAQVALGGLLLLIALLSVVVFLMGGIKAKRPGKGETAVMERAKRWFLVGDKTTKNPMAATKENIAMGQQNFSHYCFACHGLDGQNTGVPFADIMSPPVPSLASASVQAYTDGQLHWIISNGLWLTGMPASKGILNDDEIWSIVLYIRNLPPAGSLGEPAMYSGDLHFSIPTHPLVAARGSETPPPRGKATRLKLRPEESSARHLGKSRPTRKAGHLKSVGHWGWRAGREGQISYLSK